MRKLIALAVALGLVGGFVGAMSAQAKVRLVAKSAKFYLRDDDGCDGEGYLSKKDGTDTGCWQLDSFLNEPIINQAALLEEDLIAQHFVARDGVPLVLNSKKNLTGQITTYSGACIDSTIPCSPVGVGAGQASIDVAIKAFVAGGEKVLGEKSETFAIAPSQTHTMELDFDIPDSLNKKKVTSLQVVVYPHGVAAFHSGVELEDPASTITVPTLVKKR
jgi:hypothetical protein